MNKQIDLQIHNKIPEIERVCESIAEFCREHSISDKIIFSLHLALDEILTNIISYGYCDKNDHVIDIRYSLQNDYLTLEIEDDSNPYDPANAATPDINVCLEDRKIGGLGIYLIKSMMGEIKYSTKNGKNKLILTKKCQFS